MKVIFNLCLSHLCIYILQISVKIVIIMIINIEESYNKLKFDKN